MESASKGKNAIIVSSKDGMTKTGVNVSVRANKQTRETDMASQPKMKERGSTSREARVEKLAVKEIIITSKKTRTMAEPTSRLAVAMS